VGESGAQPLEAIGGLKADLPALGDFCNFSINITHFYAYLGQNNYFKVITHQLKSV